MTKFIAFSVACPSARAAECYSESISVSQGSRVVVTYRCAPT